MKTAYVVFVYGRVVRSLRELFWTHLLTAGIMAMTLSVFGGFLLIQDNVHALVRGWSDEIQVFVYLDDGVDQAAAEAVRARLADYPEVKAARYVSKEQAWEAVREDAGIAIRHPRRGWTRRCCRRPSTSIFVPATAHAKPYWGWCADWRPWKESRRWSTRRPGWRSCGS